MTPEQREKARARQAAWRAANPEKDRAQKAAWYAANRERECARAAARYAANPEKARAWRAANREKERAKAAARYAADPEKARAKAAAHRAANLERVRSRQRRYEGLPEPGRPMPSACECCGRPPGKRALNLDHDHLTGAFRGWLCHLCNTAIGKLGDCVEGVMQAVEYLKRAQR